MEAQLEYAEEDDGFYGEEYIADKTTGAAAAWNIFSMSQARKQEDENDDDIYGEQCFADKTTGAAVALNIFSNL